MSRCLHITINESPAESPGRTTANRPVLMGTDPGSDYVMPRPDNPGADYVMPRPDNPGSDYVMPRPDNPSGGSGPSTGAAWGTPQVRASVQSGCCSCGAPASTSPAGCTTTYHPFIAPHDFSGFVIVRMAQGIDPNAESLWELADRKDRPLPGLKAALELPFKDKEAKRKASAAKTPRHLISRALVELKGGPGDESDDEACGHLLPRDVCIKRIRALERATALTSFRPLHSLTAYWRLDLREHLDHVEEVVAALNRLAEVDLAYRELAANDPQTKPGGRLFAEDQGYLSDSPAGISASWAWKGLAPERPTSEAIASKTAPLTICDLEQGWNRNHQELKNLKDKKGRQLPILYGANQADEGIPGHHGTAVLGQLAAAGRSPEDITEGTSDICHFVLASHYLSKDEKEKDADTGRQQPHPFAGTNGNVATAIMQALEKNAGPLGKGDILLLEVQRGLLPTEVDEADFDAIRLASGLGILVIEAAGNGGFDLDAWSDPKTHRSLQRGVAHFRDSGAVLVGASRASLPHDRAPFSNYGSRLDCYGWGEAVTTCGYGDLFGAAGDDDTLYTNSFSGTSSASPIIAGAAALLQALHIQQAGCRLEPQAMRDLLSDPATGTRQGPNVPGHIGVMPDLKAIVNGLRLVPVVYMRRSVFDDGSTPGPDDEISSSPDILLWQGDLNQTDALYGAGKGRENLPAPGSPMVTANLNRSNNDHLYVRLRNRGLGNGSAHIHLFASPAATLITPERWIPWGSLDAADLPQGDTLTVAAGPAVPLFTLPSAPEGTPDTPWSFLAVLFGLKEHNHPDPSSFFDWTNGLPPGLPYFNWNQYRAFLRQPGVAWRNTHRVTGTVGSADTTAVTPSFFIAGTPDRARLFDFEVIQRLPEGATVTFEVLTPFDAKLRQRKPWIDGTESIPPKILLPKRPWTAIREVELAAGTHAEATFTVTVKAPNTLNGSHSLAVRQLWHGEEVGRITWYFGLDN
jgi:serine protease